MAAFPNGNALKAVRDSLRDEITRLQATVAMASDWVEALERDRLPLNLPPPAPQFLMTEVTYDASLLGIAQALLVELRAETSTTSSVGLKLRVKNTLTINASEPSEAPQPPQPPQL